MLSVVRSSGRTLCGHKCLTKEFKRFGRFMLPQVVDKPPDYYQTIEQKLNEINYYENAINLFDIGFANDSDVTQKWSQVKKDFESKTLTRVDFEDFDEDEDIQALNYRRIYEKWLLSDEGVQSIIDLANHYAIFKDLFPPSHQIQSVSSIESIPPKPTYYFRPLVPLKAEFCVLESEVGEEDILTENSTKETSSENKSDDIIVSPVFRGNLLYPQKCQNCPNVSIDASAINGINNFDKSNDNYNELNESNGQIRLLNDINNYYTLCLISLDSLLGNESNVCHWMTTNIHNTKGVTSYETVIKYLPVFGVKGLGYHRYVFLLYKHKSPLKQQSIDDFDLKKRSFNALEFMSAHGDDNQLTPVGLSWFQTIWDYSSQKIFYDYLDMRSPYYQWIPPKDKFYKQLQFPARAPFNIYLDQFRDPKDLAKDVLLERLKSVNPYDYKDTFKEPVLPHIHPIPIGTPDWLKAPIRKRRSRIGIYRGLRPHSAIEPFDNNADLDQPKHPRIHPTSAPVNQPLPYPDGHRRPKPLRDTFWVKPPNEHPTYRIAYPLSLPEDERKNVKKEDLEIK